MPTHAKQTKTFLCLETSMTNEFQTRARQEGARFEEECAQLLRDSQYRIIDNHRLIGSTGISVDFVVEDASGETWYVECKGGRDNLPGARRTDNVKKALHSAYVIDRDLKNTVKFMVMVTADARPGSRSQKMLETAKSHGVLHAYVVVDDGLWIVDGVVPHKSSWVPATKQQGVVA